VAKNVVISRAEILTLAGAVARVLARGRRTEPDASSSVGAGAFSFFTPKRRFMARGRPARAVLRRASLSDGGETSRRAPFSESRKSRDRFRASSNFTNERIDDDYASYGRLIS
jgi:hypothetical protein